MSETLDPTESGKKAAAVASPELLMAGHSEMKRRSKRAVSASSSLLREKLWLMLPEFRTKAPGTLVRSSLKTLISSSEETLQKPELWVTGFGPSPLTSLLDLPMTKPLRFFLKRRKNLSFICVDKHVFTLTGISHLFATPLPGNITQDLIKGTFLRLHFINDELI